MDCARVADLLPWLANGRLPEPDNRDVRAHLAGCAACRREFQETLAAWQVFDGHLPSRVLVEYAFDGRASGMPVDLVEQHLENCARCREEVQLAQRARANAAANARARATLGTWFADRRWSVLAAAAALLLITAASGWMWMRVQSHAARLLALQDENQRLRTAAEQQVARLEADLTRLSVPSINGPVIELFPAELVPRGEPADARDLSVPPAASTVTLILSAQHPGSYPSFAIEIVDGGGRSVWSARGLVRHRTRDFTVTLPARFLAAGSYRINVYGDDGGNDRPLVAHYLIRVP